MDKKFANGGVVSLEQVENLAFLFSNEPVLSKEQASKLVSVTKGA